jgi:hypothetical protein
MLFAKSRLTRVLAACAVAIIVATARPVAHDIVADVVVQAFVKPDGDTLRVLVRVPLAAMRDIAFPTRPPGFLEISQADALLRTAAQTWLISGFTAYENDRPLPALQLAAARVSLPSDRAFATYQEALAHITAPPLPDASDLYWNQALLDVQLETPISSDRSRFSIDPGFERLGLKVVTALRFITPDGQVRPFEYRGDAGLVRLDPRWHQAAMRFVGLGFLHILDGVDHLLFLLCLVIPFRRVRDLVIIVTSFTVAHSITLIASALNAAPGALWFPPLIETLIAVSIVYMALENIVFSAPGAPPPGARAPALASSLSSRGPRALPAVVRRRWIITFLFGLVHGFGFSFALRETLQFAGSHLLTSLVSFNVGVELGQLFALAIMLPALFVLFRFVVAERIGTIILSAIVAHTAWHWMTDRGAALLEFPLGIPDPAAAAAIVRWLIVAVAIAALLWLLRAKRDAVRRRDEITRKPA